MMTSNDYNLLVTLLRIDNQHQVKRLVTQVMRNFYGEDRIEEKLEYTYVEGDIPIMLVAHCDTVCVAPVTEICATAWDNDKQAGLTNKEQAPLGADDRAGIFIILKIIADGYRPYILFTTDEEIGGVGAMAAADNIFSPDIKFILELDRQGANDAAMYECGNEKFIEMLKSYGFEPVSGTFSDICFFAPEWDIAATNLSVGYYHEHTPWETLYVRELETTLKRVEQMLDDAEKYEYFDYQAKYPTYKGQYWDALTAVGWSDLDFSETKGSKKSNKKKKKHINKYAM